MIRAVDTLLVLGLSIGVIYHVFAGVHGVDPAWSTIDRCQPEKYCQSPYYRAAREGRDPDVAAPLRLGDPVQVAGTSAVSEPVLKAVWVISMFCKARHCPVEPPHAPSFFFTSERYCLDHLANLQASTPMHAELFSMECVKVRNLDPNELKSRADQ